MSYYYLHRQRTNWSFIINIISTKKHHIYRYALLLFLLMLIPALLSAQPANNDCSTATPITTLNGQCSAAGAFTTAGATASGQGPTGCFTSGNDVWFSFVAQATDVTITINGNNASSGGTLTNPQVGLLSGTCTSSSSSLTMFHCATDVGTNNNGVELYGGALTIGQTYYIRVSGANGGTFQICVNNYFAPPNPESDCIDAVVLCDKSSFTVQSVSGAGNDNTEMSGSSCGLTETNSSWYTWTCDQSGTLEFALTPTNSADDLDFIVYKFTGSSCGQKTLERCMAAGDFVVPSPCMGPTGLGNGATDVNENPGCSQGQDSWLAPLNMLSGERYALVVNNYTSSGNGFQVSFGGTGTFLGPQADFVTNDPDNTICIGNTIVFTDNSNFPNGSDGWAWNFGVGASPQVASGPGPHTVTYNTLGTKSIALTVESSVGCVVSTVKTVVVDPCCDTENQITTASTSTDATCPGAPQGTANVSGTTNFPPFTYQWSSPSLTGANLSNLYAGTYTVTMTDQIGCTDIQTININQPPPFSIIQNVIRPTCNGGTDGSITLSVSGASPSYQYDWGNGFINSNINNGLSNGNYTVTIRDSESCDTTITIPVFELTLELDTLADFVIAPSCYGLSDGSITISMANGLAPYLFDWNDGNGFVTNNTLFGLSTGTYTLNVQDANLCEGGPFDIFVNQPDSLIVMSANSLAVSCYQDEDGQAIAQVSGGTPNYNYTWSAGDGINDSINTGLAAGNYLLTVTDFNGCTDTASVIVTQPDPVSIPNIAVQDAACYADSNGTMTVQVAGGTPPFEYSIDGQNFQTDNLFTNLTANFYTVFVRDVFGCEITSTATVSQPWIFTIDAGENQVIDLGYEADISTFVNTLDDVVYSWSPPNNLDCIDCVDVVASPIQTTTYTVTALNEGDCPAEDSVTIFVDIKRPYFVPNVFTPNYDGHNDNFYVYGGVAIQQVRVMKIFDRWGGHVFEANNIPANQADLGWDGTYRGKAVEPAVFVYYIEIEFIDGHIEVLEGDVTVLR